MIVAELREEIRIAIPGSEMSEGFELVYPQCSRRWSFEHYGSWYVPTSGCPS